MTFALKAALQALLKDSSFKILVQHNDVSKVSGLS